MTLARLACAGLAALLFLSACGKKAPLRPPERERPAPQAPVDPMNDAGPDDADRDAG